MSDDLTTAYKLALEEITRLNKELTWHRELQKVQSDERWSWSERKTKEVRQLTLSGPEVGALVEALKSISDDSIGTWVNGKKQTITQVAEEALKKYEEMSEA